jgi:hypothetical protein
MLGAKPSVPSMLTPRSTSWRPRTRARPSSHSPASASSSTGGPRPRDPRSPPNHPRGRRPADHRRTHAPLFQAVLPCMAFFFPLPIALSPHRSLPFLTAYPHSRHLFRLPISGAPHPPSSAPSPVRLRHPSHHRRNRGSPHLFDDPPGIPYDCFFPGLPSLSIISRTVCSSLRWSAST